ncbi:hypothetical protein ACTA71_010125 [Dictyostelium dimigraforme]
MKDMACSICLSEFEIEDSDINSKPHGLPCCNFFHKLCLEKWIKKNRSCPNCFKEYLLKDSDLIKCDHSITTLLIQISSLNLELADKNTIIKTQQQQIQQQHQQLQQQQIQQQELQQQLQQLQQQLNKLKQEISQITTIKPNQEINSNVNTNQFKNPSTNNKNEIKNTDPIYWDTITGFNIENIPLEWKQLFRSAGIKKSELKNPETAQFIIKIINEHCNSKNNNNTNNNQNKSNTLSLQISTTQ